MAMAAVKLVAAFSLAVSLTLSPGMACPGGRGATNMQTKFKPGTCASRQNYSTTCCPLIHCKAEDGDCYCDNNCFPNRDCCADVHCVKHATTCREDGITECCIPNEENDNCLVHNHVDRTQCSCAANCSKTVVGCCPDALEIIATCPTPTTCREDGITECCIPNEDNDNCLVHNYVHNTKCSCAANCSETVVGCCPDAHEIIATCPCDCCPKQSNPLAGLINDLDKIIAQRAREFPTTKTHSDYDTYSHAKQNLAEAAYRLMRSFVRESSTEIANFPRSQKILPKYESRSQPQYKARSQPQGQYESRSQPQGQYESRSQPQGQYESRSQPQGQYEARSQPQYESRSQPQYKARSQPQYESHPQNVYSQNDKLYPFRSYARKYVFK